MNPSRLLPRALLTAALALAVIAPGASAETLLSTTLQAPSSAATDCTELRRAGTAGVVQRRVTMPASGVVAATLRAGSGDWDLGLFDAATKRLVAGSAAFGASEVASGFAGGGRELVVQACRRSGTARSASVSVVADAIAGGGPEDKPSLVRVPIDGQAEMDRLVGLGLDVTENDGPGYVDVAVYGLAERRRLRDAGFDFEVRVDDLVAEDSARLARERALARGTQRSALPSGRETYRRLPEYEAEMKALVEQNPGLVKPVTLPLPSLEGRTVQGLEISENVNVSDGKPVFLQMGAHHAREWPSAEHTMEFGVDLIKGYNAGDARIRRLVGQVRTIVIPVVNVDGFNVSREAPVDLLEDPEFEQIPDPIGGVATANYLADPAGAYRRRNCRLAPNQAPPPGACALPVNRALGTDPNRNYGGLWGGPGASALPAYDTYRGSAPFSEPEVENIRRLVSSRQVTTLITNHTFSNLILRPPGVRSQGQSPDEVAMADLGARMAAQNGYANQPSYGLYDTTGTTEDWTYYATGGFGYTFEIGPSEGEGSGFHPAYPFTVKQYTEGQNGAGGNREAYLIAMENAADAAKHSTLVGRAPKGVTLRVRKDFVTETSPVRPFEDDVVDGEPQPEGDKIQFPDALNTTFDVPGGEFRWSMNPSTRPAVAANRYQTISETPTREEGFGSEKRTSPGGGEYTEANYEEEFFTVREEDKAFTLIANVRPTGADDYDTVLYRREGGQLKEVGSSGGLPSEEETIVLENPPVGDYVLRVNNYAAFLPYEGEFQIFGPGPEVIKTGTVEAWNFTCEADGKVFFERKIVVARGETVNLGNACGVAEASRRASVCATASGFRSTSARPVAGGRRVRFGFSRLVRGRATIDVFQVSKGRRAILGERRVARFTRLSRGLSWDGTGNDGKRISDGVFFIRYKIRGSSRNDFRRAVLVRRKGRFYKRRTHYRPNSCGLLTSAKLERPVFGGRTNRPLRIAFRTSRRVNAVIQVRKGKKVVRTIRANRRAARRTHRFRIRSEKVRRGLYTVRIAVRAGNRRASAKLLSERL